MRFVGIGEQRIANLLSDRLPVIARRKQFSLRPMDEWEAIEQMELLGHTNFFVFYNAKTEAINVLYRRYDGTLGLIQPYFD
jgi:putative sigma-54 modulation protein